MITVLVVAASEGAQSSQAFALAHPSVEIMTAAGLEEALEKLARNRRIDAVLLLAGEDAVEVAATIREEDPGAPPLFCSGDAPEMPGVRRLEAATADGLLELIVHALSADR